MTLHQQPLVAAPDPVLGREVLVVVPALNEARGIAACLRSLLTGDPRLAEVDLEAGGLPEHVVIPSTETRNGAEAPSVRCITPQLIKPRWAPDRPAWPPACRRCRPTRACAA